MKKNMNIKGYSEKLTIKKRSLVEELAKPKEEQNIHKIRRLRESIRRNKKIALSINHKKRFKRWK